MIARYGREIIRLVLFYFPDKAATHGNTSYATVANEGNVCILYPTDGKGRQPDAFGLHTGGDGFVAFESEDGS